MAPALQRAWLRRGPLARLLWPLSLIFGTLAAIRRGLYSQGWIAGERMAVPVIVVGGVVAGGSGKTPVVMAVVEHLRSRGLAAGVVSRGYGRATDDCREVRGDSRADEVGDEPLLVAQRCAVPVFVAARRAEAARALLAAHPQTRVLVSDDGLQHYRLRRDIEICIFDERATGNGWLLPAGPLREPWPRRVDLVLRPDTATAIAGFESRRRLAPVAVRGDGARIEMASLRGRPLTALAGIARPQAFFDMLRAQGLQIARGVALPDHHDFGESVTKEPGELICTEKDAVKLWRFRPDAWAVPLLLEIEPPFWAALDRLVDAKLSSRHGPETS
ncbi:MAG: tetraacyldisaccharide 4'-kinase [Ramlibacter sp.]|nr:tetraacyldisaccharide 4'-kinase [Ramlibacter sp.]